MEKINKIDKPLARFIKIKERRLKSIKLEIKKKKEFTADTVEIPRILRHCYTQLYANKMQNLEEMEKLLGKCSLPRVNEDTIKNLNRLLISIEIKTVIKK